MLSPSAMTKISVSAVSVSPTVATASAPRRDTQNTSTTPNSDSMHISSTIGTANSTMARLMLPSVKSWLDPITASRSEAQMPGLETWIVLLLSLIRIPQDKLKTRWTHRGARKSAQTEAASECEWGFHGRHDLE